MAIGKVEQDGTYVCVYDDKETGFRTSKQDQIQKTWGS
jgi:hypothetical protein